MLFLLFAFKQHRVRNLSRNQNSVPQGVSVPALWLTFVSCALAGADLFFGNSSTKAYNAIAQAFADPQAKKFVDSAAGSFEAAGTVQRRLHFYASCSQTRCQSQSRRGHLEA